MKAAIVWFILVWSGLVWAVEQDDKPDPTKNVMELVRAAVQRLDDINIIQKKALEDMIALQNQAINDKLMMFMQNSKDLSAAEKSRVDAIRSVDVSAAAVDRERAATQATALASQVTASAENLRALVSSTAVAEANRLTIILSDLTKRIADLERVQSIAAGSTVGVKDTYAWLFAGIMTIIAIAAFIIPKLKTSNGANKC